MKKKKTVPAPLPPTDDKIRGEFYNKNVRYHHKDGTTCLVTYGGCKDKPIDRWLYQQPKPPTKET